MDFQSVNPTQLIIIATIIALIFIESLDANQLNILGNFIVAFGGLLLTAAAQEASTQSN